MGYRNARRGGRRFQLVVKSAARQNAAAESEAGLNQRVETFPRQGPRQGMNEARPFRFGFFEVEVFFQLKGLQEQGDVLRGGGDFQLGEVANVIAQMAPACMVAGEFGVPDLQGRRVVLRFEFFQRPG
jgi:hypothetical protein